MTRLAEYDDFERALLGSARSDAMAPEKKRALALALGGGAAVVATASTAAGAAKATNALLGGALAKWLVVGVAGTALAVSAGVVAVSTGPHELPRTMVKSPPPLEQATHALRVSIAARASATPAMNANDLPAAPLDAPEAKEPPRAAAPAPSITEEIAIVSRARQALRSGDVAGASSALDAHDQQFPHGALGEETAVLRIEVAYATDPARGKKLGRAFLAKHPQSPHAARVRGLLGADE